jgi:hypothetical protein
MESTFVKPAGKCVKFDSEIASQLPDFKVFESKMWSHMRMSGEGKARSVKCKRGSTCHFALCLAALRFPFYRALRRAPGTLR